MARQPGRAILSRPTGEGERRGFRQLIGEIISELRKVTWPSRQEATRLTLFVIAVAIAMGIFLGVVDIAFTQIFNRFILR